MNINFYQYRTLLPIFLGLSFIFHFLLKSEEPKAIDYLIQKNAKIYFQYLPFKDTIYFLGKNYIEISLKEQKARLIWRNDSVQTFRISSGNENIKEGQNTPEGYFTIQNKSPMAISKQFNNAELFNWIGFNGNVGFHGLKGSGYYGSLGFRPSSHGCVRISREDGQILYQKVSVGTPVIVFKNNSLRVIKFIKPSEMDPEKDYIIQGTSYASSKILNQRLMNIYNGSALRKNDFKVISDGKFVFRRSTVAIGDSTKLPAKQKKPLTFNAINFSTIDKTVHRYFHIPSDTCKIEN